MLTDAEYQQAIKCRDALQGQIDAAEGHTNEYDRLKKATEELKDSLEGEMSLYRNFLKDAIEEYEKAHEGG